MNQEEQIIRTEYSELMQKSYIDYAMSVIIARALPDVRDGLKPVQRRTLYDMYELGIRYDKPYRKCARIVGDTMGKYHPHGDSSIYDALVVMAQDFKKGLPLVDGHGNFGSIEGDGAAAMRYTEARLQKITQEAYLADLDKDVVNFVPNFDETEKEPEVLPVKVPNLLLNGAEGIAVGMTTSIPPHNFGEVIDGVIAYMKDPDINTEQMMQYIPGPDFPTGGIVANKDELLAVYSTGMGKIKIRGKVEVEKGKGGKDRLVITEIPYTMIGANIGKFLNDIYSLVETKKTSDIVDITNQSSKEGIRIVLELKKGADVENLKNLLYKKTKLEDTFGVNMLAVADGKPETMGIVPIIRHHVNFQYELATRKYQTLLAKERDKKEIQEGLIKATDVIPGKDAMTELVGGTVIVIVKDETALEKMRQQLSDMETAAYGEDRKVDLTYMMNFDMSGSVEEKIACANAVRERLNEWQNDETNPQIMRLDCNVVSRAEGRIDYESSNGGLFFLGLFLGSMFLMITVLIIYYKQISEGYEDKERFAIMEKVGMSNAEVKASIRSQVRTVFFLPLVTAACHLAAAYPMLKKMLALVALYNGTLFAWCLAGTVLVFGLIYLAVFAVTSRSYYKIVGNQV